jgi:hypothetical protein
MTDLVTAIPGEKRIVGPGWSLRAERVDVLDGNMWRALIGIRRGLKLLVARADETELLQVEAWTAEPGQSDGVAVVEAGDGRLQLARVPLCGCGDRGCGNVGVQLGKYLPGGELPALIDLLRELSRDGLARMAGCDSPSRPPPGLPSTGTSSVGRLGSSPASVTFFMPTAATLGATRRRSCCQAMFGSALGTPSPQAAAGP